MAFKELLSPKGITSNSSSNVDLLFRRVLLLSKTFTKSWGSLESINLLKQFKDDIMSKGLCTEIIERSPPKMIITKKVIKKDHLCVEGEFISPVANYTPNILPKESHVCYWKGFFPLVKDARKVVIHLAGTGDHTYVRRQWGFSDLLLKSNVGSILIENPYYGKRRPQKQFRSSLMNVTDLYIMGAALMTECNYLLTYAKQEFGLDIQGISGVSMGGFTASLAATNISYPIALIPILSGTCASVTYSKGILSDAVGWDVLKKELESKEFQENIRGIKNQHWLDELDEYVKKYPEEDKTREFLRIMMREFTFLGNYPQLKDPSLATVIIAESDSYVLQDETPPFAKVWPGSEMVVIPGLGHIQSYITSHSLFRSRILETLNKLEDKNQN